MDNLVFERIWQDPDFFEIRITAKSNNIMAFTDCYCYEDTIAQLSRRLSTFPCCPSDSFLWENDTKGQGFTPYVSLRFHCKDRLGHIAIEVYFQIENGGSYNEYNCRFFLFTEIGVLNRFGKALQRINRPMLGTKVALASNE